LASTKAIRGHIELDSKEEFMTMKQGRSRLGCALSAAVMAAVAPQWACAQGQPQVPPYMNIIVGEPSPAETAKQNMLALNTAMFGLYGDAGKVFQRNILGQHPIILALFSGAGGRFILYRPGQEPLEAPSVPIAYQLLKSVGHSSMVLPVMAGPHIDKPASQSWRGPMQGFRAQLQAALDGVDLTDMPPEWRADVRSILKDNVAFADASLSRGVITFDAVKEFTAKQGPKLKKIVAWAAETQVAHWVRVVGEWKRMLGADWEKTYGASNTIYVARQNNVLFSVLAQFFGPEAINERLIMIETISFTTTPDDMLDSLTRILSDRTVGQLFFGNLYMMDYELMGSSGRDAIVAETRKLGMTAFLPPLVPFGSKQWPTLVTPGPGPSTLLELP
jgi:hypothetical protein